MSFGVGTAVPAHEKGNPILPRPDRTTEAPRLKVPPVPRAPRAKPRTQSAGALMREMRTQPNSSRSGTPTKSSELRRPREDSPFGHARVSTLTRERGAAENQRFEMGPAPRVESVDRSDYARGHILKKDFDVNNGMPWSQPKEQDKAAGAGRRSTLQHERKAADQALEWVPESAAGMNLGGLGYHGRVNVVRREQTDAAQTFEMAPGLQANNAVSSAAMAGGNYGRKYVMARERRRADSVDCPRAVSMDTEDGPSFRRRNILVREGATQVAAH